MSASRKSGISNAVWLWRAIIALFLVVTWEGFGRLVDATWTSQPSLIVVRIVELLPGRLSEDIGVTLAEIVVGLLIGLPSGVVVGLLLGRRPFAAALLRPVIVAVNSVPIIALAPLLIMWFGLGLAPKIAMVALVVFFLIFFNTFAGAQAVDKDWIVTLEIMGSTSRERFQKVIAPACLAWVLSGLKSALPYSLIAATVGEMMLARAGLGNLITASASHFDMTGVYTGLFVLMALGGVLSDLADRLERRLLRWRPTLA
jgi:NitT/TauT family transport system permease protein